MRQWDMIVLKTLIDHSDSAGINEYESSVRTKTATALADSVDKVDLVGTGTSSASANSRVPTCSGGTESAEGGEDSDVH